MEIVLYVHSISNGQLCQRSINLATYHCGWYSEHMASCGCTQPSFVGIEYKRWGCEPFSELLVCGALLD